MQNLHGCNSKMIDDCDRFYLVTQPPENFGWETQINQDPINLCSIQWSRPLLMISCQFRGPGLASNSRHMSASLSSAIICRPRYGLTALHYSFMQLSTNRSAVQHSTLGTRDGHRLLSSFQGMPWSASIVTDCLNILVNSMAQVG